MVLPYAGLLLPLLKLNASLVVILSVMFIYTIIFSYFLRYKIFEEGRLRKQLNEMDENQISDVSFFYGASKITTEGENSGLIHYEKTVGGKRFTQGFIVTFDKGSTINVPQGNAEEFRKSKQYFLRELGKRGYSFRWYSLPKTPYISKGIKRYIDFLEKETDSVSRKVITLNLNQVIDAVISPSPNYTDYILVTASGMDSMRSFKSSLNSIIAQTLSANVNSYIKNPRILSYEELPSLFSDYYLQENFDLVSARRLVDGTVPFSTYAKIVRAVDTNGTPIMLGSLYNELNKEQISTNKEVSLDSLLKSEEDKSKRKMDKINREKENQLKLILNKRQKEEISDLEYKEEIEKIERDYTKEAYLRREKEEIIRKQELRESRRKEQEERKNRAKRNQEKAKKPETKWYENEETELENEIISPSQITLDSLLDKYSDSNNDTEDKNTNKEKTLEELLNDFSGKGE